MCRITGTFQIARHSTGFSTAFYIAHSTAKAYGISADYTFLFAFIAKYHHAIIVLSLIKRKSTEIHPRTTTYLLIYFELSGSSIMENNIFGVTYAIRQSLIRDVYSIIPCFRNIGYPLGKGFIFFLFGLGIAGCTGNERIFVILIYSLLLGKPWLACLLPTCFSAFDF